MSELPSTRRPQTDLEGSLEVLCDDDARATMLLRPGVPVELRRRGQQRRFALARVGLSVVAISGLCLVPASSLAEDGVSSGPIVSAACDITGALSDGTPSGVLADGTVCILPPRSEPTMSSAPGEKPGPAPTHGPVAEPDQPPAAAGDVAASSAPAQPAATADARPGAHATAAPGRPTMEVVGGGRTSGKARPRSLQRTSERKSAGRWASRRAERAPRARLRARTDFRRAVTRRAARGITPAPLAQGLIAGALPGLGLGSAAPQVYVSDQAVIPRFLIRIYKQAERRYRVPWPILAAINEIETDFGRNVAVSSAGAVGWMQFMPATWRAYGVDADDDGVRDPDNPRDAIFAAARYLRASGARHNMRRAIFAYNHAGWYVDSVLLRAERIAAQQGERDRRLSRLFDASARRLEGQVLADPRIALYDCGRRDIAEHRVDRRVLVALRFLAWSGLNPTVSSLQCGHGLYTKSGNVSEHSSGNAVDISAINGIPILGHQGSGSVTEAAIRELLTLRGAMRPHQIISLMTFAGADNTIAMSDHADHIHVGFRPLAPVKR